MKKLPSKISRPREQDTRLPAKSTVIAERARSTGGKQHVQGCLRMLNNTKKKHYENQKCAGSIWWAGASERVRAKRSDVTGRRYKAAGRSIGRTERGLKSIFLSATHFFFLLSITINVLRLSNAVLMRVHMKRRGWGRLKQIRQKSDLIFQILDLRTAIITRVPRQHLFITRRCGH